MLIPNAKNAVVDVRKLRDYCLNPEHSTGKHKARLFYSTLGMTAEQPAKLASRRRRRSAHTRCALDLQSILLKVVQTEPAKLGRKDAFGQRYTLDFTLEWQNKSALIRSSWIIEVDNQIPRLTSCYPFV